MEPPVDSVNVGVKLTDKVRTVCSPDDTLELRNSIKYFPLAMNCVNHDGETRSALGFGTLGTK